MSQYILKTLGCKANLYDTQLIEKALQEKGWNPQTRGTEGDGEGPNLCIINSCTVTDEADRQSRKLAARLSKENPKAIIVMTGCSVEVNPEGMAKSKGVDFVVGNQDKHELVNLVLNKLDEKPSSLSSHILNTAISSNKILGKVLNYQEILSKHPHDREWAAASDSFKAPPQKLVGNSEKTRAFLKIQEGCNAFCTYCIIPYGRGPSRSLRPRELIQQILELERTGMREVVLTGTNIGDYGLDWQSEPALGDLLEMIMSETSVERLRLSSLNPTEITPQIFRLMEQQPRLCPHFHISLQSPHSRILKLMKRKYAFEDVQECLLRIAGISGLPGGVYVGMDIITGFPGETEEEFEWTKNSLSQLPWTRLHVFPYSERLNTPATRLPYSVPQHIRLRRSRELNNLSLLRLKKHYQGILEKSVTSNFKLENILLEKQSRDGWISGFTPNYLRILFHPDKAQQDLARNSVVSAIPQEIMVDQSGHDVSLISSLD